MTHSPFPSVRYAIYGSGQKQWFSITDLAAVFSVHQRVALAVLTEDEVAWCHYTQGENNQHIRVVNRTGMLKFTLASRFEDHWAYHASFVELFPYRLDLSVRQQQCIGMNEHDTAHHLHLNGVTELSGLDGCSISVFPKEHESESMSHGNTSDLMAH